MLQNGVGCTTTTPICGALACGGGMVRSGLSRLPSYQLCQKLCQPLCQLGQPPFPQPPLCQPLPQPPLCQPLPQPPLPQPGCQRPHPPFPHQVGVILASPADSGCAVPSALVLEISARPPRISRSRPAMPSCDAEPEAATTGLAVASAEVSASTNEAPRAPPCSTRVRALEIRLLEDTRSPRAIVRFLRGYDRTPHGLLHGGEPSFSTAPAKQPAETDEPQTRRNRRSSLLHRTGETLGVLAQFF